MNESTRLPSPFPSLSLSLSLAGSLCHSWDDCFKLLTQTTTVVSVGIAFVRGSVYFPAVHRICSGDCSANFERATGKFTQGFRRAIISERGKSTFHSSCLDGARSSATVYRRPSDADGISALFVSALFVLARLTGCRPLRSPLCPCIFLAT